MKVCPSCGAKAQDQAPFCNDCGEPLAVSSDSDASLAAATPEKSEPAAPKVDEPSLPSILDRQSLKEPSVSAVHRPEPAARAPAASGPSSPPVPVPQSESLPSRSQGSGLIVGIAAGVLIMGIVGGIGWAAYSAGQASSPPGKPPSEAGKAEPDPSGTPSNDKAEPTAEAPSTPVPEPPAETAKSSAEIGYFRLESLKVAPGSFMQAKIKVAVEGAQKAEVLANNDDSLWRWSSPSDESRGIDQTVSVRISRESDLRLEAKGSDGEMKSQLLSVSIHPTTELSLLLRSEPLMDSLVDIADGSLDRGDSRVGILLAPMRLRDVWIVKNTFFAFYGLSFKNPELSSFFSSQPWYSGYSSDADGIIKNQMGAVERRNCIIVSRLHDYLFKQNGVPNETLLSEVDSTLFGQAMQYAIQNPE